MADDYRAQAEADVVTAEARAVDDMQEEARMLCENVCMALDLSSKNGTVVSRQPEYADFMIYWPKRISRPTRMPADCTEVPENLAASEHGNFEESLAPVLMFATKSFPHCWHAVSSDSNADLDQGLATIEEKFGVKNCVAGMFEAAVGDYEILSDLMIALGMELCKEDSALLRHISSVDQRTRSGLLLLRHLHTLQRLFIAQDATIDMAQGKHIASLNNCNNLLERKIDRLTHLPRPLIFVIGAVLTQIANCCYVQSNEESSRHDGVGTGLAFNDVGRP